MKMTVWPSLAPPALARRARRAREQVGRRECRDDRPADRRDRIGAGVLHEPARTSRVAPDMQHAGHDVQGGRLVVAEVQARVPSGAEVLVGDRAGLRGRRAGVRRVDEGQQNLRGGCVQSADELMFSRF